MTCQIWGTVFVAIEVIWLDYFNHVVYVNGSFANRLMILNICLSIRPMLSEAQFFIYLKVYSSEMFRNFLRRNFLILMYHLVVVYQP